LKTAKIGSETGMETPVSPLLGLRIFNLKVDGATLNFWLKFDLLVGRWIRHFIARSCTGSLRRFQKIPGIPKAASCNVDTSFLEFLDPGITKF